MACKIFRNKQKFLKKIHLFQNTLKAMYENETTFFLLLANQVV